MAESGMGRTGPASPAQRSTSATAAAGGPYKHVRASFLHVAAGPTHPRTLSVSTFSQPRPQRTSSALGAQQLLHKASSIFARSCCCCCCCGGASSVQRPACSVNVCMISQSRLTHSLRHWNIVVVAPVKGVLREVRRGPPKGPSFA